MKKKFLKIAALTGCAAILSACLVGCDFSSFGEGGKTAYEIAVKNGFSGTEAECLRSLRGADGADASDLDIWEIYQVAREKDNYQGSFGQFLKDYFEINISENNDTEILAHDMMSVVSVYCGFHKKVVGYWGSSSTETWASAGSGVIYELNKQAGNAYVITNYHVVYDSSSTTGISDSIYLYLYGGLNKFNVSTGVDEGGSGIRASFVGGAMEYDIAVLKVEGSEILQNSSAEVAPIGNSDLVSTGERVFAIGNPEGEGIAVTEGVLSVDSEYISVQAADESKMVNFRVMRTDAAINSGNSGGALFDANGNLIGITNAKNAEEGVDNMGYALPITQVMYAVGNIEDAAKAGGTGLRRALLGITVETTDSRAVLDDSGRAVVVETTNVVEVSSGSAADGLLRAGDKILAVEIDGVRTQIIRRYQLIDLMLTVRLDDRVKVTVERSGAETTVEIPFDRTEYFQNFN